MPLGAFRINSLSKYEAPSGPSLVVNNWSSYTVSAQETYYADAGYTGFHAVPMDDTYGFIIAESGTFQRIYPYTWDGTNLTFSAGVNTQSWDMNARYEYRFRSSNTIFMHEASSTVHRLRWDGGTNYTILSDVTVPSMTRMWSFPVVHQVNDNLAIVYGSNNVTDDDPTIRIFSIDGTTFNWEGDTSLRSVFPDEEEATKQLTPLADNKYLVSASQGGYSNHVLIHIDPSTYVVTIEDNVRLNAYSSDSSFESSPTPTFYYQNQKLGATGVYPYAASQFSPTISLIPTSSDGTTVTVHSANEITFQATEKLEAFNVLKLNEEWFVLIVGGRTLNVYGEQFYTSQLHFIKYDVATNTITQDSTHQAFSYKTGASYKWRQWITPIDDNNLLVSAWDAASSESYISYVVSRN